MKDKKPKALTPVKQRIIKAVQDIRQDIQPDEILYQHSVLCQTVLPYRDPGLEVKKWVKENGRAYLVLRSEDEYNPITGQDEFFGLPFGPKARLVLMYLNSEAVKTQNPEINVGDSMTAFIKRIGLATDGRNIKGVKEQLKRLASTSITIGLKNGYDENHPSLREKSNIIKGINLWFPKDPNQRVLWSSTVRLSDDYFNTLVKHAVPLDERVIAAIKHNSMALDIYAWLAQRTFRIAAGKSAFIPWVSLHEQFGQGYNEIRMFRRAFRDALKLVQTCHHFNVTEAVGKEPYTAAGLELEFSQPPIISVTYNPRVLEEAKKYSTENNLDDSHQMKRMKARVKNQLKRHDMKKNGDK
jgi:hypothetical protein